ncbi:MAG: F0F1 ATP synthase subunit epsilon [Bacillota bacterium]
MARFLLDIVTPERTEFSAEVDMVIAPAFDGYMGVMAGHIPLITSLKTGVLRAIGGNREYVFAVSEGYMEVTGKKVIVLAEAAEMAERIDVNRALDAKRRAEDVLLNQRQQEINFTKAKRSLEKAMNRLKAAEKVKDRT